MKTNFLITTALISLLGMGCANTESDNVKTAGFYADYNVLTQATNPTVAVCSATFRVEAGGTFINLSSGDSVTCNGQAMSRSEIFGMVSYTVNLPATVGGVYTVVLTRAGESPYSASVTLPNPVSITSPANNFATTKGAPLNFSWTTNGAAEDSMRVSTVNANATADRTCPFSASYYDSSPENGTGSFNASEMSLQQDGVAGVCSMKVTFDRTRYGAMSSRLKGQINSTQQASVTITLN